MSDRIIDFNEIKNKVKDKDVDKLQDYIYTLYYQMADGKITISEFTQEVYKYMSDNNISQDKFLNMQKKLMERYGFDSSIIEEQLKSAGININDIGADYQSLRKSVGFQEKYKDRIRQKSVSIYAIQNNINDIEIILEDANVILKSVKKIDLNDIELSEFLCSYKKLFPDKPLNINLCEDINKYNYE